MKIAMLIGEPGVGKSTIAKKLISQLGPGSAFKYKKATGTFHEESGVWVLGPYPPGETFGGTDRLSMAVINDALEWLTTIPKAHSVFLEGDRLANARFIREAGATGELTLFCVTAPPSALESRRAGRGSNQNPSWLQGRRTKVQNLVMAFFPTLMANQTEADLDAAVLNLRGALNRL